MSSETAECKVFTIKNGGLSSFLARKELLYQLIQYTLDFTPISLDTPTKSSFRDKPIKDINVLVVGSTGYIGNFVVKELVNRGFNVIAVCREQSGIRDLDVLEKSLENLGVEIDVAVSCLASRTGVRYWRLVLKDWRFRSDLRASWYEFRPWIKVSLEMDGVLPDVEDHGVVGLWFEDCMQPIVGSCEDPMLKIESNVNVFCR
ncbi:divinyl chlorophyllide a 8-vinyl-reductase, chloroplastic [Tanacetum coccineum]